MSSGNEFDSNVLLGKTMDDANEFVKKNIVYFKKTDSNNIDHRITEVCNEGLKDLRIEPGRMRLNVNTNRWDKIYEISHIG